MQPEERDAAYLWNLVEAGRGIQEFTSGVTFNEYACICCFHRLSNGNFKKWEIGSKGEFFIQRGTS
jgi:hypothetical protein